MILGKQPIEIKSQEESVFSGELRDIALPYLGLASLVSLAAGTASVALSGWRASSNKSAETKQKLSTLEQNLQEKEQLLENLKVSEPHLAASGLATFLDEEIKRELQDLLNEEINPQPMAGVDREVKSETPQAVKQEVKPEPLPQTKVKPETPILVRQEAKPEPPPQTKAIAFEETVTVKPLIITTSPLDTQPSSSPQVSVQTAASKFASAQGYMGYAKKKIDRPKPMELDGSEIAQLQKQLQQMQEQMKLMKDKIDQKPIAQPKLTVVKSLPEDPSNWKVQS
ncbi:MAG TPA: hypothetical protein DDW51_11375 [Cyanobacteria bacterium UBA11367]|nr:hypothetical protein [Cyanobacteria bacterium UBA11367]HBS72702.1 hypothetical protein [Cyanobacteria bacterium UBA11153]HCA95683.1 hypothetical protein [Cyanobacteria bacterium UBA9226]